VNKLNRLYDEVIKRHNSQPYHFEKKGNSNAIIQAYNPICGDRFNLFIELDGENINNIFFHGFGCAVSKASTSVLVKCLEKKSLTEAKAICNQFFQVLKNGVTEGEALPTDFQSFVVVQEFPSRYSCAALAWQEIEKFLDVHLK